MPGQESPTAAGLDIEVAVERPDREPGSRLLEAIASELDALYRKRPGSLDSLPVTTGDLLPPGGAFLVLRVAGEAVACGGVKRLGPEIAEIKRMFVAPSHRGRGIAKRLLAELELQARSLGYRRVRLDTGPQQPAALAVYEGAGYRRIAPYNDNPYAAYWLEKELNPSGPGADPG